MKSVEVEILGQRYAIKTDEDEAYIKRVAEYIDKRLKEIYAHAPNISHSKAMIMTLFSITDELFRLRRKQEEIDRMIEEKTRILSGFLE